MTKIKLGELSIELTPKAVKHVHLSVHPPEGRVSLVALLRTRTEVARAYAISRLGLIRAQRERFAGQARESRRRFVKRETHIRLNTELVKKPKHLLGYVIVREMIHLIEPTHSDQFVALLDKRYPTWRGARAQLNELPLGAENWQHLRPNALP